MKLQQVLATKGTAVATIPSSASVEAAASMMTDKSIGALVVVDDGQKLCGIIFERDIVRSVARRAAVHDLHVRHVMTREVAVPSPPADCADDLPRVPPGRGAPRGRRPS